MKKLLQIFFLCVFLSITSDAFSTHLVGSTLTYVHTGGSNYSVKLIMYRDCAAGNSGFAATETVTIGGYDGTPSRNLVLNQLGSDNTLAPILPPCAIAPNPVPCVQQRIYTGTVILPPNPGGYHLYWESAGRNFTITNIVNTCVSCINSCLYTYIPGNSVMWGESFILPIGTTNDPAPAPTAWSSVALASTAPVAPAPVANVQNAAVVANVPSNLFRVTGSNNGIAIWTSQVIPISSCPSVNLSVDLSQTGALVAADSILVYYKLNGGPLTLFTGGAISGAFTPVTVSKLGIAGTNVQIIIRVHFALASTATKIYQFDNVLVSCNNFVANSNPVFTLLPPILVCAGQPFTFDHSATDADGDSLSYSLYTPYDANNAGVGGGAPVPGGGAKKPTFPGGNTIAFTPITWQPGYSATNPLGGTPLSLNPSTGLLSGTPPMLGQFLVGVMVKEYRNGVYMGQTIRDFQFNIVNCPPPPPPFAGTNIAVDQACNRNLSATGFIASTVNWTSVYPGALGAYNSFLSCTSGCINPAATGVPGAPPYVDYRVCGMSDACVSVFVCDTIRVSFNPTLGVTINPQIPVICNGQNNVTITAIGNGGTPPYNYLWNNVNPSQSILVGNGTYTVKLMDITGCPSATATVTVTSYTVNVSANAGLDKTVCKQNPITTLNGSVAGANGGIWSGGGGIFGPTNTTLSATYSPTPAELTAGFVDLTLTTTGSGACPAASDIVRINYINFTGTVSFTQTPVSCFGGTDGSATVSIAGGMPTYTYSWNTSPAQSTPTATNLAMGTYSVTISNSLGCTSINPVTITQPTPLALGSAITHVLCFGGNNGSISISPTGGTGPYTYLWSNGSTASLISNLTAQSYTVTVKDFKNCPITSTYTINQPSAISILLTPAHVSCFNGSNGTASSTVSGGTSPYNYNWSSGATSPTASGLQAGAITLTVTDMLGCFKSNSVTITQPTAVLASTLKTNETCSNLNNGSATAVISGGTPGYTFLWQPGALTTNTISNLSSGNYTLTAKDLNGCQATTFALITEPAPLTINFISQVNVSCFGGNNGSVIASPAGGTIAYTYLWSNGATTSQISNLSAQSFSVTVTDSKLCSTTNSVVITQPTIVTASATSTNETCTSLNNGTATAIPAGGTPGYTYLWQPSLQTSLSASNLSAGTHSVTVTDSKGCTAVANAIITEPPVLAINFTAQTNVSCFAGSNGAVTASPAGGTPGYTYLWSPGGTTAPAISNLQAGTYSVTVTDSKGCFVTNSVVITQPTQLIPGTKVTNETCNTLNDGTAIAVASGGTPGYTYLWQPGSITTLSISNLQSGTYTLTVTDFKACTAIANPVVTEPAPLTIAFNPQVNVTCFAGSDGSVTASPSGGTPNYTYLWASGGGTAASRTNLTAGTYPITVTDKNGCSNTNSVVITEPTQVVASTTVTNETCNYSNNGTATASSSGGTPGYTYFWKPGLETTGTISNLSSGTYILTATDSKGCIGTANAIVAEPAILAITFTAQTNVSCFAGNDGAVTASPSGGTASYTYLWTPGGATTATVTNLSAGKYSVTVTDNAGCIATKIITITEPAVLGAKTTATDETCTALNNGTAAVVPSGGTSGYTYLWQPGGLTSASVNNLSSGTYTLTVTDSKGCVVNVNSIITEPTVLAVSFTSQTNVSCFGGNDALIAATPSGGTPNYTYLWAPGGTTTASKTNLTAGTYSITITDSKLCTTTNSVTISQPLAPLAVPVSSIPATCHGLSDGSVFSSATGGTGTYTYNWMPGNINGSNISNLAAGTYTVTATDSPGCVSTNSVTVTEPSKIILTTFSTNSDCGQPNGQSTVSVVGGNDPYTYLWSPSGGTNATAASLVTGAYSVLVTDSVGCTESQFGNVNENSAPVASIFSVVNVLCNGEATGSAHVRTTGGVGPFTFSWLPAGGNDSIATGLTAGSYTVTVTGDNGCKSLATTSPDITEPPPILITVTKTPVSCFGGSDGTASAIASGGNPEYSYQWLPGGTIETNLSATTYTVQVTDVNSCVQTMPFAITQPPAALSVPLSATSVHCFGENNGSVSAAAAGGTPPYNYNWMPGNFNGSAISNLIAGTYTVTVTDFKGCTFSDFIAVTQPSKIVLTADSINSNCSLANGQASVIAAGGLGMYSYQWSPSGGFTATATGLLAGSYTVTVTDIALGCIAIDDLTVNDNASPVATVSSTSNVTCNTGSNGTATLSVTSGNGPFTFSWMPGGITDSIATGLIPGTYTVTVTDVNLCQSVPVISPLITQPSPIFISITKNAVSCFGNNNGSASAIASGSTPGYTYLWLPSGTTGASISSLSATTYSIQVTDTNSCVKTEPFTISEPSAALSATLSFTPSNCFGGSDGSVSATASGGTGPYNYRWMPGNFNGPIISNLGSGSYTVTVTDLKGCTFINSIAITQPTQVMLSTDSINSTCNLANGQASVIATGGAGGFLYQWSPSGSTNAAATALLAGTYSVTVTDANGCISNDSITVNDKGGPGAVVSSTTNVSCNAGSNGTATVTVSGGTGPFTYLWMPSANTDSIATGLFAGTYTVTVTDANLCQSAPVIGLEITQPYPILITVTKNSVTCFGDNDGAASAIASGGAPTYSYQWLPGGTMGTNLTNLSAATYSIQVTDFNNCVQTLPVVITEPGQLTTTISPVTNVSCFGLSDGTATATVSGGTFGYTYNWMPLGGNGPVGTGFPVGTYTLTVTDFNGCIKLDSTSITQPGQALTATNTVSNVTCFGVPNGTVGIHPAGGTLAYSYQWTPSVSLNDTASGLASGNYTILVTDNNSCKTNLAVSITEPSEIAGTLVSVNPSCGLANGSISSQISGGVLPYTYLWSFGAATTSTISGLGTGVYNLLVTDASNCTKSLSVTLTITPDPSIGVSSINNVSCFGGNDGSATINITQGTAPFAINWAPSGGNGSTASALSIGTYTISVTDALGCLTIDSLIIAEPTPVDVSISSITDVLCNGGNTGTISVAGSGGTGPLYTYLWAPGGSTLSTATNLTIGTYTVNVMDQNNCPKAISASITEPVLLSSSVDTVIHATCYNGPGSASVLASGGVLPYSYSWSAPAVGQAGSSANNLIAGSYTVTSTDANGCVTTTSLIIKQPLQVITSTGANDTLCLGQTGSISATAAGGAGGYYYAWQPSGAITAGTLPITPTSNTTYTVVAFDQIGCAGRPDTVTAIVYNLTAANVQAMGITPICPGQSSSVYVETTGITGPLTYQWNNNLGTGTGIYTVTPAQPTTYVVTVSNMCGLSVKDSVVVLFNPQPTMALSSGANTLCVPGYMPFFDNSVAGNPNDPITSWQWNFGDGTFSYESAPNHNYSQPGNYLVTLTVKTEGGCTSNSLTAPLAITAHPIPNAVFSVNSTNLNLPFDALILNNQSVGANSYYWEFGDGGTSTQFNPQYLYSTVSNFHVQLIAMSQYSCVDTAFAEITTNADVIFPNAFTPNPNGSQGGIYDLNNLSNDIFFPYSSGVIEFKIEIFNRWGEEVFESLDIKQGWDGYYHGAICSQDVYVWKAYVKLNNGKEFHKNGDVTILRY
ncbi:MAG: PKD domain-containing protein [Bacteroidota bacterium]